MNETVESERINTKKKVAQQQKCRQTMAKSQCPKEKLDPFFIVFFMRFFFRHSICVAQNRKVNIFSFCLSHSLKSTLSRFQMKTKKIGVSVCVGVRFFVCCQPLSFSN